MKKKKVFISSVQSEFAEEREFLVDYFRTDPLLKTFFEPFIFEEVPATTHSVQNVYLKEVELSDIYIGLLGQSYGYEDSKGISPTEKEYDLAKKMFIPRWIYIKKVDKNKREIKEEVFIKKIEQDVSRKMFSDKNSLKEAVYNSCVLYLKQNGKIETSDFDDSINNSVKISDIDKELLKHFVVTARKKRGFPLKETASVQEVLKHLNLIKKGKIVNSGVLAFSKNPQGFFPSATVKCAHFHGLNIQKPIPDYKEFGGTVFNMAQEAVDFVLSKISLSTGTRDKSNQVETVYEVPRAVVAEAIINAVAHRDYYSRASVQVSVFKDRIEVSNPGELPPELGLKDLKKPHSSYPRNPLLAGCLFLTGDIERYGTGIIDMYNLTKERGLISPDISLGEGFKVTIWRPQPESQYQSSTSSVPDQYQSLKEKVLNILSNDEFPISIISEKLGQSRVSGQLKVILKELLTENLIEMTIPDKPNSRFQKYRLTEKGRELKLNDKHKTEEK